MILKSSAYYPFLRLEVDLTSETADSFKKLIFDDIDFAHFPDDEDIVKLVDFDCGSTFHIAVLRKIYYINRNRQNASRSCENPSAAQVTINITVFYEAHTSNIFLDFCSLGYMGTAALLSLSHTPARELKSLQ